jgi:Coenzyme PQQ synthesis protein D (PqqD)
MSAGLIAVAPSALAARVLDETVVLDADRGSYYRLNAVGGRVWDLLADHPRSLAGLVEQVVAEYEVDAERARADIVALLGRLADHGLVAVQD